MKPDLYIARRYLVARKSLGVIHVISTISAVGMAIGSAALILILSVYNGFDRIIIKSEEGMSSKSKTISPEGEMRPSFANLENLPLNIMIGNSFFFSLYWFLS